MRLSPLLEHLYVEDVLAHEHLVLNLDNLVFSIAEEHHDIVEVGAVLHEFGLLQTVTDESLLAVDV